MSDAFVFAIAQFFYFLWPVFVAATLVYSLQGHAKLHTILRRMRRDLLVVWVVMFLVWLFTLFAPGPNVTIIPEPYNTPVFLGGLLLLAFGELGPRLHYALCAAVDLHRTHALSDLKQMDPGHFEELVTTTYRALGYHSAHMGRSSDHGLDVLLRDGDGDRWVVQCKRYQNSVGESIVRDLYGTMFSEGAKHAILVTTADITPPAKAWARGKPIMLVDGPALLDLLDEARRRREGTLIDRLAGWLIGLSEPALPVTSNRGDRTYQSAVNPLVTGPLRTALAGNGAVERTQPVRLHRTAQRRPAFAPGSTNIQTAPLSASRQAVRVWDDLSSSSTLQHNGSDYGAHPAVPPTPELPTAALPTATLSLETQPQIHSLNDLISAPAPKTRTTVTTLALHCPACGAVMVRKPLRPGDRPMRLFNRCSRYPECRAVVEG